MKINPVLVVQQFLDIGALLLHVLSEVRLLLLDDHLVIVHGHQALEVPHWRTVLFLLNVVQRGGVDDVGLVETRYHTAATAALTHSGGGGGGGGG